MSRCTADSSVDFTQYGRIFLIVSGIDGSCGWAGLATMGCISRSSSGDGGFTASADREAFPKCNQYSPDGQVCRERRGRRHFVDQHVCIHVSRCGNPQAPHFQYYRRTEWTGHQAHCSAHGL